MGNTARKRQRLLSAQDAALQASIVHVGQPIHTQHQLASFASLKVILFQHYVYQDRSRDTTR
jgi:hypothetical protein